MPELLEQGWEVFRLVIAPALGASLVVMVVVRLSGGEALSSLAAALALVAGVVCGNHFKDSIEWEFDKERPLTCKDVRTVIGWSLESKPAPKEADSPENPDEPSTKTAAYWLPWLAGVACLLELLIVLTHIPSYAACVLRTFVAVFAARLLTPAHDWRVEMPWISWALAAAIIAEWSILETLARKWKDGTLPLVLAVCLGAAGMVLVMQAASARRMDMALGFGGAMLAIALVACFKPSDTGPALAAAAVFLPSILLLSYHDYAEDIPPPLVNFLLVGLAPLALTPMLLPVLAGQKGWKHWLPAIVLPLIPVVLAVVFVLDETPLSSLTDNPSPPP